MNILLKHFILFFFLWPATLLSQELKRVVDPRLKDTILTTGLQTIFSSQTIGEKVTTQLRSAVSTAGRGIVFSFGITTARRKAVATDEESKAILKTASGKRIELAIISGTMDNFPGAPSNEESLIHFSVHTADIPLLKKEKITGIKIIGITGNYNYDLHAKSQEILNTQLNRILNTTK